jgi:hypothetical protein
VVRSSEIAIFAVVVGAGFWVVSALLGVWSFKTCWDANEVLVGVGSCSAALLEAGGIQKEAGFVAAINWSIGLILVYPAFLYFFTRTFKCARQLVVDLLERDMLVTEKFRVLTQSDLTPAIWRRVLLGAVLLALLAGLTTLVLYDDFLYVVDRYYADPSLFKGFPLNEAVAEVDWSVAAPACDHFGSQAAGCARLQDRFEWNKWFAAAGYVILPWSGGIAIIALVVYLFLFASLFVSSDFRKERFFLVPNLHSQDPRKGFEVFEELFLHAAGAALMAFALGYLVVLQNVYLRSDAGIVSEIIFSWPPVFKNVFNINTIGVGVIGALLLLVMLIAVFVSLSWMAVRGRDHVLKAIQEDDANVTKLFGRGLNALQPDDVQTMLTKIFVYWPVRWFSLNTLVVALTVGILSLFAVTVAFYLVVLAIGIVIFGHLWRRLRASPLRVLMAVASPPEEMPLASVLAEMRDVETELRTAPLRTRTTFRTVPAAQWRDIVAAVTEFRPNVLHFSGHGGPKGIVLHDEDAPDRQRYVTPDELRNLIDGKGVRVLVLNCCYSQDYAEALVGSVEAVVGTKGEVFDEAARAFSAAFYRALASGASVGQAVKGGRKAWNGKPEQFDISGDRQLVLIGRAVPSSAAAGA